MQPNPFLKKLGFADNDKVVVFHADDVGMCHASVPAFRELNERGRITSGATMVPCAWFPAVAASCRDNPEIDMGVHLTFTSEWDNYRWGPLSTREQASGLLDDEGYFYRTAEDAQNHAEMAYIEAEVMAQVECALAAGIDVTHVDTHMGTMLHPKFLPAYIAVGRKYRIPLMALRLTEERLKQWDNPNLIAKVKQVVAELEEDNFPTFDHFEIMPLREPENRMADIERTLESIGPGLTHFVIHPTYDTPEIRDIAVDWQGRLADYQGFSSDEFVAYLAKSGIQTIGYRELREVVRGG